MEYVFIRWQKRRIEAQQTCQQTVDIDHKTQEQSACTSKTANGANKFCHLMFSNIAEPKKRNVQDRPGGYRNEQAVDKAPAKNAERWKN
jgi:hypothetical protein